MIDTEIDNAILAVTEPTWRKVAMIIPIAAEQLGINGIDMDSFHEIAKRVEFLVQTGQLISQGDIKLWRYSEVKLP